MIDFRSNETGGFIIKTNITPSHKQFIWILTEKSGLIQTIASLPKKFTHQLQGKTELLSYGQFKIFNGRQQFSLSSIANLDNSHLDDISANRLMLITQICQICQKVSPPEQPNPELFNLLLEVHNQLKEKGTNITNLLIYFLTKLLVGAGALTFNNSTPKTDRTKILYYCLNLPVANFISIKINDKTQADYLNFCYQILNEYAHSNFKQLF